MDPLHLTSERERWRSERWTGRRVVVHWMSNVANKRKKQRYTRCNEHKIWVFFYLEVVELSRLLIIESRVNKTINYCTKIPQSFSSEQIVYSRVELEKMVVLRSSCCVVYFNPLKSKIGLYSNEKKWYYCCLKLASFNKFFISGL